MVRRKRSPRACRESMSRLGWLSMPLWMVQCSGTHRLEVCAFPPWRRLATIIFHILRWRAHSGRRGGARGRAFREPLALRGSDRDLRWAQCLCGQRKPPRAASCCTGFACRGRLHVGEVDIVVQNGRVRAGYQIGGLLQRGSDHAFGSENDPGRGSTPFPPTLTYGRDKEGRPRWSSSMDHSSTNVICGINRLAKHPAEAAREIAECVARILQERRSGVELSAAHREL